MEKKTPKNGGFTGKYFFLLAQSYLVIKMVQNGSSRTTSSGPDEEGI